MAFSPHILILAAGQGKRMHSDLVKIMHPVLFRPMLHYVLDLACSVPHESISVVIGCGGGEVKERCREYNEVQFIEQKEPLGTADAVKAVLSVERAETLDHLRRNASQFIEDLKMAGFGSVDIEFSQQGASEFTQDMEFEDSDSDPSFISAQDDANDIIYLSLRDDAQLNVLV